MIWIKTSEELPNNEQEVIVYSKFNLTVLGKVMEYEYLCSALYDKETNTFLDRYHHLIPNVSDWMPMPNKPLK